MLQPHYMLDPEWRALLAHFNLYITTFCRVQSLCNLSQVRAHQEKQECEARRLGMKSGSSLYAVSKACSRKGELGKLESTAPGLTEIIDHWDKLTHLKEKESQWFTRLKGCWLLDTGPLRPMVRSPEVLQAVKPRNSMHLSGLQSML